MQANWLEFVLIAFGTLTIINMIRVFRGTYVNMAQVAAVPMSLIIGTLVYAVAYICQMVGK